MHEGDLLFNIDNREAQELLPISRHVSRQGNSSYYPNNGTKVLVLALQCAVNTTALYMFES